MTGGTPTSAKLSFEDANGGPLASGTLTVYLAGTTTPTPTWQDFARTTLNTNPITLNARGECVAFLNPDLNYKFLLKDSTGATIYTQDNVLPSQNVAEQLAAFQVIIDSVTPAIASANRLVWIDDYGTNTVPGTTDMTAAINAAIAAVPDGGVVRGTGLEYLTTSEIAPINRKNITLKDATILGSHTGDSIISLSRCGFWKLENIKLNAYSANAPNTGLILGVDLIAPGIGGGHTFINLTIVGAYNVSGLYNVGSSDNVFINPYIVPETSPLGGLYFSDFNASSGLVGIPISGLPQSILNNNSFTGGSLGCTDPTPLGPIYINMATNTFSVNNLEFNNCTLHALNANNYVYMGVIGSATNSGALKFTGCTSATGSFATNGYRIAAPSGSPLVRGLIIESPYLNCNNNINCDPIVRLEAPVIKTLRGGSNSILGDIQNGDLQLHAETSITIQQIQSTTIVSEVVPTITNRTSAGGSVVMSNLLSAVSFTGAVATGVTTISRTTNVNITVDAGLGNIVILTNTSNNDWTMLAPTNPTEGQQLTFLIDNLAAGSRIVTFTNSAFKSSGTLTLPNGLGASITFLRVAGLWLEIAKTTSYDF